jgi:hypothetical protein
VGIFNILAQGFGTAARKVRLAFYLWLAHLALAVLLIAPAYFIFQKEFARSLMGGQLFSGVDVLWLGDLIYRYQSLGPVFLGWLLVTAAFYVVVRVFLNGGVIGRLTSGPGRVVLRDFFQNGAAYFWRLARVFLISVVGYLIVLGGLGRLVGIPFHAWTKNASTQWTILTASTLRLLVFLLLLSIVKMFFDYVKVILIAEDKRGAVRMTLKNFGFVGRRFLKVWGIFLMVGALFLALSAVYLLVGRLIPRAGGGWAAALFLWQQVYVFAAGWVAVLFFATEYHVWRTQQFTRT